MDAQARMPPPRRWFRFGLRGFLIAVTVFSAGLGYQIQSARRQKAAVDQIVSRRGTAVYDFNYVNDRWIPVRKSPLPRWLLALAGKDQFHNVHYVYTREFGSADDCQYLTALPKVRRLFVGQPTDEGMQRITNLKRLDQLWVEDGRLIGTSGVEGLGRLSQLSFVSLIGMRDGDQVLQALSKLPEISMIGVYNCNVSDKGLVHLAKCKKLTDLDLGDNPAISDGGLAQLAKCKDLTSLTISGNRAISDRGIAHLADLPKLAALILDGTGVTNQGITLLENRRLRTLSVLNTQVNDTSRFRRMNPKCLVRD